ncbi:uncharacterized protein LOC143341984 [Colletes latitarsis]|uniref:uncharacterized protein LOC143341984 n=1 Tax=Colletes latitarsis TaxID=2605962 RepID=UPI0040351A2B
MSETVKQISSDMKEHNLLKEETKSKDCCRCSIPYKLIAFCVITCCIFIIYWILLTPVLVKLFPTYYESKTNKWSIVRFVLYCAFAFIIWLFIMLCLTLIWRRIVLKENRKIKLLSYGTNTSASLNNVTHDCPQSIKFVDVKDKTKIDHDENDRNSCDEPRSIKTKMHKDLPPLVIHRRNTGSDIESAGAVDLKENDKNDEDVLKSGNEDHKRYRESMKEYMKLVTVTPDDESDVRSPKGPLSPRDLFFIDLLREAEKAERSKAPDNSKITEGKRFFPRDFSPDEKDIASNIKYGKQKSIESPTSIAHESTYFIANIDSPKSEKSEVYLNIDPDPELLRQQPVNLNSVKADFVLQENPKDSGSK